MDESEMRCSIFNTISNGIKVFPEVCMPAVINNHNLGITSCVVNKLANILGKMPKLISRS